MPNNTPDQIFDPITGYRYPREWIDAIQDPAARDLVQKGLAVLTADGSILRRGFTTGSTASAVVKAVILAREGSVNTVEIPTPSGIRISVPVNVEDGEVSALKFSGDYPGDVTAGIRMVARLISSDMEEIIFGEGIGRWSRDTPRFRSGDPAVSPTAATQIRDAFNEGLRETGFSGSILLTIPEGMKIAERTLNHKIGVDGGISLLGSTGFVEPWDDHLEETTLERALKAKKVVLTTGRSGLRFSRLLFPDREVILAGSKIKSILPRLSGEVIICGLPALILKYANPDFLRGSGYQTVEEMIGTPDFFRRMKVTLDSYAHSHPTVRIVVLDREGRVLGETP